METTMQPTLVILAAGVGSRYGGPKQLAPIGPCGETLLEYSVFDALQTGFARVVLVVRPESEFAFRHRLDVGMANHVPVAYVHQTLDDLPAGFVRPPERVKPWGTGQAVLAAEPQAEGSFVVVNADDFYGTASFELSSQFLSHSRPASIPTFAMVGFEVGKTLSGAGPVSRGLCLSDDVGRLQRIIEIPQIWKRDGGGAYRDGQGKEVVLGGHEMVSMNMWGFTPKVFPALRARFEEFLSRSGPDVDAEFYLPDAIQVLVDENRAQVEILSGSGRWGGITYREDEERVATMISELVAQGRYPQKLWR